MNRRILPCGYNNIGLRGKKVCLYRGPVSLEEKERKKKKEEKKNEKKKKEEKKKTEKKKDEEVKKKPISPGHRWVLGHRSVAPEVLVPEKHQYGDLKERS